MGRLASWQWALGVLLWVTEALSSRNLVPVAQAQEGARLASSGKPSLPAGHGAGTSRSAMVAGLGGSALGGTESALRQRFGTSMIAAGSGTGGAVPRRQSRNITVVHEHLGPSGAYDRWDDGGGKALDAAIKGSDDGPVQLQYAMIVLATVAGSIICGGGAVVACCWMNRERGFIRGSSKYAQVKADEKNDQFKGQGAKWLQQPV